jgi:hypothetical protein
MSAAKYGAPGSFVARIITPALAHAFVLTCESTRALMLPSATRGWLSSLKLSYTPQMSPPPACTVQLGSTTYCEPAAGCGKPMSWHVQPVGHTLGGGAAAFASETVSNVPVARVVPFELTAMPATIGPPAPSVTLEPMMADQATPSADVNAVYVFP